MTFLKRYENDLISLGSYVLAFVWFSPASTLFGSYWLTWFPAPESIAIKYLFINFSAIPGLIMIAVGIYFAFKSKKLKESSWIGIFLGNIGILALLLGLIVYALSFGWSTAMQH